MPDRPRIGRNQSAYRDTGDGPPDPPREGRNQSVYRALDTDPYTLPDHIARRGAREVESLVWPERREANEPRAEEPGRIQAPPPNGLGQCEEGVRAQSREDATEIKRLLAAALETVAKLIAEDKTKRRRSRKKK